MTEKPPPHISAHHDIFVKKLVKHQ